MSDNFERWRALAARAVKEQNSAKLAELATEMNLVLKQKTPIGDSPANKTFG
jgi:hypothetical protein